MNTTQTKVSMGTIARTVVLVAALANQALVMMGKEVIPWSDSQIYDAVTTLFTIGAALTAWWKNNSFTSSAVKADIAKDKLKANEKLDKLNESSIKIVEEEAASNEEKKDDLESSADSYGASASTTSDLSQDAAAQNPASLDVPMPVAMPVSDTAQQADNQVAYESPVLQQTQSVPVPVSDMAQQAENQVAYASPAMQQTQPQMVMNPQMMTQMQSAPVNPIETGANMGA